MTKRKKTTQKKTEVPKLPRVRNCRMVKATADSPIYKYGFVIGGGRLDNSKTSKD
jgi:hypothetical protein